MQMTKKVLSIVLAVMMVVSMMAVMGVSASAATNVCILDDTTEYTTVAGACAAITDSDVHTIKLLANSTSTSNIGLYQGSWSNRTGGKNVVLDLNGFTYTQNKTNGTGAFVLAPASDFSEGSSLVVKDTSSAKNGKITSNSQYCTIISGSMCTFTLEKGTIENTSDAGSALQISGSGEATLKSGTLSATDSGVYMFPASGNNTPKLTVQGSTISAYYGIYTDNDYDNDDNVTQYGDATVLFKSGTINANQGIVQEDQGTVTVSGGTINADYAFVQYDEGEINVSNGTLNATYPVYTTGDGDVNITGGLFSNDPVDYVDTSVYKVKYTNTAGKVKYLTNIDYSNMSGSGTYQLLGDLTANTRIVPGTFADVVTIDLNGYTLTSAATDQAFLFTRNGTASSHKSFTITDTSANGGGKIVANSLSPSVNTNMVVDAGGKYTDVTISNVTIESPACGVALFGDNDTLTITNSSITSTGDFAIATNGKDTQSATITVTDSTLTSVNSVGVYLPAGANATFTDTDVTGTTAMYIKSGNVTINGGTYTATGAKADYTYNGGGCNETGDAVVVDNCGYPGGTPSVSIVDGTFKSANAEAVSSYSHGNGNEAVNGFIAGGNFSSDVTPLVVEGYMTGNVGAGVAGAPFTITLDTNPLNPTKTETPNDENAFGINCKYLMGTLLGVQKKTVAGEETSAQEGENNIRFVAVLDTDLLQGADDYGFVLAKVGAGKDYNNTNIANLKVNMGNGEKTVSAKGTYNNVCDLEGYGDPEANTPYKYITCAVNNMADDDNVVARFYYTKGGKTYYAKYAGHDFNYTGCISPADPA